MMSHEFFINFTLNKGESAMKKQLTMLVAASVWGITSGFAANPFSDVTPDDWAYQAVAQLAKEGIINGYPEGYFNGQHNITRYEMAQMLAKALAHKDRNDAEQNVIINRLSKEFATELSNLGVRTDILESKIGNFAINGDARLMFEHNRSEYDFYETLSEPTPLGPDEYYRRNAGTMPSSRKKRQIQDHDSAERNFVYPIKIYEFHPMFTYRARLQFTATVNDNTKAVLRVSTGDKEFGSNKSTDISFDRLYLQHNFGKYVTTFVGRYDTVIGGGLTYDGDLEGATIIAGKDKLNASFTFGYAPDMAFKVDTGKRIDGYPERIYQSNLFKTSYKDNAQLAIFQLNSKIGPRVKIGTFYTKVNGMNFGEATENTYLGNYFVDYYEAKNESLDFYGIYGNIKLGSKLFIDGEFAKFKNIKGVSLKSYNYKESNKSWTVGLTYGDYVPDKRGSWSVKVQYNYLGKRGPVFAPTFWTPAYQNYKGWALQGKYAVANNVGLKVYAMLNPKDEMGDTLSNFYRGEINYQF